MEFTTSVNIGETVLDGPDEGGQMSSEFERLTIPIANPASHGPIVTPSNADRSQQQSDDDANDDLNITKVTYSWKNINAWVGSAKIPASAIGIDGDGDASLENSKSKSIFGYLKKEPKYVLKNVSGTFYPSELVAVLGASGAGKTTLMDVLSFRNSRKLKVSGVRTINGTPIRTRNAITSTSAYVQQIDLFFGVLTVREHLVFQALVRMHEHIPRKQRMIRVEEVIREVGLTDCADTQIGTRFSKAISGGEMKRLAIATEVLTDPMFMCCDEPTSGLDSTTAQQVVSVLKDLSNKGKTVICTVHQPSSHIFALFDKVLLMAKGRVAFQGTTAQALEFFSKLGYNCPAMFNPSDFLIDTLAIKPGGGAEHVSMICDAYDAQLTQDEGLNKIGPELDSGNDWVEDGVQEIWSKNQSRYKASVSKQFRAVFNRALFCYLRDPMLLRVRLTVSIMFAVFLGCIFYQLDLTTYRGLQNLSASIFMIMASMSYQYVFVVLDAFCSELPVFLREHFNGMYRADVYFVSKILVELPFNIFQPVVFTSICYVMMGFEPDWYCYLNTVLISILLTNNFVAVGYLISCLASTITLGLILVPVALFPGLMFCGFLLRPGTGPVFLVWIEKVSWFYYGYEAIAIQQLKHIDLLHCPSLNGSCPQNGLAVLEGIGFNKDNFEFDVMWLAILAALLHVVAYLALLIKTLRH